MKVLIHSTTKAIALVLVFFHWAACSSPIETVKITDEQTKITEEYQRDRKTGKKQGKYMVVSPEGIVLQEANYIQDSLEGLRVVYNAKGAKVVEEYYKNNQLDGLYRSFVGEGVLQSEGEFKAGLQEGEWKFYYPDGQLKQVVNFSKGQEDGPFTEYHANGKTKAQGSYKVGINRMGRSNEDLDQKEHGKLILFDENGDSIQTLNCEFGICETVWSKVQPTKQ